VRSRPERLRDIEKVYVDDEDAPPGGAGREEGGVEPELVRDP
jgi:hypothetical protein